MSRWQRKSIWGAVAVAVLVALIIVSRVIPDGEYPTVVRVGVLPDESEEGLRKRYDPLLAYLARETAIPHRLIIPASYGNLLELFRGNEIDLAFFGGLTFVQAREFHGAVPLVARDVDTRFTSYFLVRADNPAKSLADFEGKTFTFGSRLSTSGHLMPRHFLKRQGIEPETFFSEVRYSGTHDKTASWVRDGEVDIGVANSEIVDKLFREGRLRKEDVRVLWTTLPYFDYVWAVQRAMDEATRRSLRNAFLNLSIHDVTHAEILGGMGTEVFYSAGVEDFRAIREIARTLGMLERGG